MPTLAPRWLIGTWVWAIAACVAPGGEGEAGEGGPECGLALVGDDQLREIKQLQLDVNRDVDLLFVVDDSASMAAAQAKLAAAMPALVAALEAEDVDANYRIGVTTTNHGNPLCDPALTTPESGNLVASACTTRLADFVVADLDLDAQALACTEPCTLDAAALAISPTTTDRDPEPKPRPWLERIEGRSNLPAGTDLGEALRCIVPQGVAGCGFESPLESMYLALARSADADQASYGFMRDGAVLAIVLVSDEVDCSYEPTYADVFEPEGERTFWSDPLAPAATSAVCWNAGVACVGDPSGYDACDPVDKRSDGGLATDPSEAVLRPLTRYLDRVQGIEDIQKELNPNREVLVALIGGVEGNGPDWSVHYAEVGEQDPEFDDAYGIGPGCVDAQGQAALPPVRMRNVAEAFEPGQMYSICADDFGPALTGIVASIADQLGPACFLQCAGDRDPTTQRLEPNCILEQKPPGLASQPIPECLHAADGSYLLDPETGDYQMPSDADDVCYAALVDPDGTHTAHASDDMSPECVAHHYNLEFELARRPGVSPPSGTAVGVDCALDPCPQDTCPDIGLP